MTDSLKNNLYDYSSQLLERVRPELDIAFIERNNLKLPNHEKNANEISLFDDLMAKSICEFLWIKRNEQK